LLPLSGIVAINPFPAVPISDEPYKDLPKMKRININALFPLLVLAIAIYALSQQMFNMPPFGKLLDPFSGAVQNENDQDLNSSLTINGLGLSDPVHIFFDGRNVPHIYATNNADLYFAQGYITAGFRLWQMDFLSYAAAGRLSEIFKDGFLLYDRDQRRIGILQAARVSLKMMENNAATDKVLTAYTMGVNAYIRQLNYKKMPLEYKLLDYSPEPWSKLKTVLIMKYMANTLSGYEDDVNMSKMILALGEEKFNKYFPEFPPNITPVMDSPSKKVNPLLAYIKKPDYLDYSFMSSGSVVADTEYNPKLGSNSWAVSGKKTRSGFPILCSDPHLNLSLPSIWMEMQLSSPGMNVYGVSIPGTPAIIIGFNEKIAWGITNGADDVKDWYKLKIMPDYSKYEYDGRWLDMKVVVEEIKRKDQQPFYDTVYYTVHGPIVNSKAYSRQPGLLNYALKWELHRPSNEILSFIELNKATNYEEYKQAISSYSCPTQNFTFACKDNTIAINHQGNMAIKWPGQGKFILDGSRSSCLYTKYIPAGELPQVLNPSCNYVLSANQHPTNASYPYFYNGYYSETRAGRIKRMLDKENMFDLPKMEAMQTDNTNQFALDALPVLIRKIDPGKLDKSRQEALEHLSSWKGTYNMTDKYAELFELWWKTIKDYTWDEFKLLPFYAKSPEDAVLLDLIEHDPENACFDRQGTPEKENASDIILHAFIHAMNEYDKLKDKKNMNWGDLHKVNLMHLTNIGAFSRTNLSSAGNPEAINAMSSNWGPSWRMIVELGERPRAVGVFAGGQSGNPGSPGFDNFIDTWNHGKYFELTFYMSGNEAKKNADHSWVLK